MLEVRLLGKFEVRRDDTLVAIPSRPAQTLFAHLILTAGTSHRRERLAGLLWPDSLEETARDNLRHSLWRLRKALEPDGQAGQYLRVDDLTIAFDSTADYWLDSDAVEKTSESAPADGLMTALSAYQGELLPGFYDEWVVLEREHLQAVFEHKMARLLALLEGERRWLEVLDWGERWVAFGQKPEPAYRALMSAHAALGEMSKVAATYARCANSLKEFGIEPSEQTRQLYENLRSGKGIPTSVTRPSKAVAEEVSLNIPVPLTSFIGRERELTEIAGLLSTSRLLTLTGPGGVGKTRLAIQTARDSSKKFRGGVFWVGLVGLSDPNLIPQEIAQSLNVREVSNTSLIEVLKAHIKSKELLIVLDNCEHLIRASAQCTEQLLAACPNLRILATSIEALGLFNETTWQVPSLPLPEMQQPSLKELQEFASIDLFVQRARAVKTSFTLTDQNATSVAQICQRLDGIPLAIELAAARIKLLSIDEIAARLDDRFSLLTTGSRTAIPRHQTLRATIDWSYDLLSEPERILLRRLSVFAGGFTLGAGEAVCSLAELKRSNILDLLGRLVDKSLVIVEADPAIRETRYRLLETIRQYALEKLVESGEGPAIRDRHLGFYLSLAEEAEPNMFGSESAAWFQRLDRELDNVRGAMEWSTNNGKADAALRIAGSLVYFWFAHGLAGSEWHDRVQEALSRPEGRERTLARAKALNGVGFMYWADIYPTDRRPELEEALSIAREHGDQWNIATALRNLGLLENIRENYREARSFLDQSLDVWRVMGPEGTMGYANTLIFLGDLALNCGEAERAHSLFEESVGILREPGDINFLAYSTRRLGQLAWRSGDYGRAVSLCRESLSLNREVGDPRGMIACLAGFAAISVAQGKVERAAQLMGAVETYLDSIGIRLLYVDKMEYERNLSVLHTQMNKKAIARYWAQGKALTMDQAIQFALQESRSTPG